MYTALMQLMRSRCYLMRDPTVLERPMKMHYVWAVYLCICLLRMRSSRKGAMDFKGGWNVIFPIKYCFHLRNVNWCIEAEIRKRKTVIVTDWVTTSWEHVHTEVLYILVGSNMKTLEEDMVPDVVQYVLLRCPVYVDLAFFYPFLLIH